MDQRYAVGLALTGLGVIGYVIGLLATYPGRAFSITAVMVGVTLVAIGDRDGGTA